MNPPESLPDNETPSLRRANKSDSQFLFTLRNEPVVRASAFNQELLQWEKHVAWFDRKLADTNCFIFIVERGGIPVGQVRIDLDPTTRTGEVDVAIDPTCQGKGLGATALTEACQEVFAHASVDRILGHAKKDNIASQKALAKAGFATIGETTVDGNPCIEMVLLRTV